MKAPTARGSCESTSELTPSLNGLGWVSRGPIDKSNLTALGRCIPSRNNAGHLWHCCEGLSYVLATTVVSAQVESDLNSKNTNSTSTSTGSNIISYRYSGRQILSSDYFVA